MTTMGNIPTLAELRARKAASTQTAGGLPTLAELRARKARGDSDPVAQALAKIRAETAAGVPPMGPMGTITPNAGPVVQTVGDMADADYLARNPTTGGAVGEFARGLVNAPMATAKGIAGLVGDPIARAGIAAGVLPEQVGTEIDRNQQAFGTTQNARGLGGALGSGVGQVLTGGGIAKGLGVVAGAGTLAAQGAEAGYQDYRQSVGPQEASTLKALAVGGGYGLAEYVGERFGLGALLKAGNAQGFRAGLKAVLQSAGVNASEEFVTQVAQNAISQRYDPSRELTQGAGMAAGVGAFAGGVGAAAMRGAAATSPDAGTSQQTAGTSVPPRSPTGFGAPPANPIESAGQASQTPPTGPRASSAQVPAPSQRPTVAVDRSAPVATPEGQTRPPLRSPVESASSSQNPPSPSLGSSRLNIPEGVVQDAASRSAESLPQSDPRTRPAIETQPAQPVQSARPIAPAESSAPPLPARPQAAESARNQAGDGARTTPESVQGRIADQPQVQPRIETASSEVSVSSPNPTPESGRVGPPPGDVAEPKKPSATFEADPNRLNLFERTMIGQEKTTLARKLSRDVIDVLDGKTTETAGGWTRDQLLEPGAPNSASARRYVEVSGALDADAKATPKAAPVKESLTTAAPRPEKSPPATPKVAEADAPQTPPKSPANDPQAPADAPTDPPRADAEAAQQILDDGGGISDVADQLGLTIPEAVEIVDKPKKKDRKPAPWSKADLSDRIRREYENGPYAAVDADTVRAAEDVNAFEGSGMLRFKGKAPADLLEAIEGRPELRRRITENAGSSSMGDDYLSELGTDGYVQMLESQGGRSRAQMVEAIRNDKQNPQGRFLADLSEHTGKSPAKVELADTDRVLGTKFKINGNDAEIVEGRYGLEMVVDEMGTYPIDAIESIPADRGSIQRGGVLARAEAALERTATRAKKRLADTKSIKRGRSTGSAINPWTAGADVAVYLSSKIAKAGVRGVRATLGQVRAAMDRFIGFGRYTDEQAASVLKDTNRLIARSRNKFGGYDLAKLELLHNDLYESVSTEPVKDKDTPRRVQTAADAAVAIERQGAAIREGMATAKGKRKLSELAEAERTKRQEMREAFIDRIEQGKNTRAELARIAREELRPEDRDKVLTHIAKGETEGDLVKGIRRILDVQETTARRNALKSLADVVGKAPRDPSQPPKETKLRTEIDNALVRKDPTYVIDDRISRKELAPDHKDAATPLLDSLQKTKKADGAKRLADFIEAERDEGRSNFLSDADLGELRGMDGKAMDSLTTEQVALLGRALQHLNFLSENSKYIRTAGKKYETAKAAAESSGALTKRYRRFEATLFQRLTGKTTPEQDRSTIGTQVRVVRRFLGRSQRSVAAMIDVAFGKGSPAHEILAKGVQQGRSAMGLARVKWLARIIEPMKGLTAREVVRYDRAPKDFKISGGGKISLTESEAATLVGAFTDKQYRQQLLQSPISTKRDRGLDRSYRLTESDISEIEGQLSDRSKALIESFRATLKEDITPAVRKASIELYGVDITDNPDYWPQHRDPTQFRSPLEPDVWSSPRFADAAGITKQRRNSKAIIEIRSILELIAGHTETAAALSHVAVPVNAARSLLADPDLRAQIRGRLGDEWEADLLNRYSIASGMNPAAQDPNAISTIGHFVKNNAVTALAFNLASGAVQVAGVPGAMSRMTPGELKAAFKRVPVVGTFFEGADRAAVKELQERSGYFAERWDENVESLATGVQYGRVPRTTPIGRGVEQINRVGFVPMTYMDQSLSVWAYKSAQAAIREASPDMPEAQVKDQAAARAEELIRETQNPSDILDASGLGISARSNPATAAFVTLTSSGTVARNLVETSVMEAIANPTRKTVGVMLGTAVALAASEIMAEAIREFWRRQRSGDLADEYPEGRQRSWSDHATNIIANYLGYAAPKVDSLLKEASALARGKPSPAFNETDTGRLIRVVSQGVRSLVDEDYDAPDGAVGKNIEATVKIIARVAGVGGEQLWNHIKGVYKNLSDD